MAHHAKIENGIVTQVIVTCDADEDTFADRMLVETGEQWLRTSYNNRIRYNFAGLFYSYDPVTDAFIAPKPECGHPELILDTDIYQWNCENADHKKVISND
jgi:hypothetical protein